MKITIIIPYKVNRGWLQNAIDSVPKSVQLIVSQGEGNWPQNFNKALPKATGDLIKFLHEDDMLTPYSIEAYITAFSDPSFKDVDFAHGCAWEIRGNEWRERKLWIPKKETPTLEELLVKNTIHSASLIYRREVFEKIGGFCESPKVYSFEEYEFNLRCLKNHLKIGYIGVPLAYYRRHSLQIIRNVDIVQKRINKAEILKQFI